MLILNSIISFEKLREILGMLQTTLKIYRMSSVQILEEQSKKLLT